MSRYVVKLGGHALDSLSPASPLLAALADDVRALRAKNIDVVIVHGGGPQITELLEATGRVTAFHDGLRVTDEVTMEYVAMALGRRERPSRGGPRARGARLRRTLGRGQRLTARRGGWRTVGSHRRCAQS